MDITGRVGSYFTNLKEGVKAGKDLDLHLSAILKEKAASSKSTVGSLNHYEVKIDRSDEC